MSAGVHGNETAPIELLNQLVGDLLAGRLPLKVRLLVVLGNPAAMRAGKRYLHSDMNRMFGGRYRNFAASGETVRAQQLERALAAFFDGEQAARFHYDLHTAIRESRLPRFGILPFQKRPYSEPMLQLLDAADLDALVVHSAPGGTFSHYSSEHSMRRAVRSSWARRGRSAVTICSSSPPSIARCGRRSAKGRRRCVRAPRFGFSV